MYYTDAVAWAAENHIVSGYGNGEFGPEEPSPVSKWLRFDEIRRFRDMVHETDLSKYTDEDSISGWAKDAMSWANANGLIQGDGVELTPSGNAIRCQVASILQRFIRNVAR